jgi:hypothetical protein
MAEQEPVWHDFTILVRELGVHEDGAPRGRSYFEDELEEELEGQGLGEVTGGGSWMDGSGCDIQVIVSDPEAGLLLIRDVLRRLGAPESTRILGETGEHRLYG